MRRRESALDRNRGDMKARDEFSFSTEQEVCFRGKEFFFSPSNAGMLLKKKDGRGKPWV
jgi:hypothetical protein